MTATRWGVRLALVAGSALAVAAAPYSSAAVPAPTVAVAPAQGATVGFATPKVVAVQGQAMTFDNADLTNHTLTSVGTKRVRVKRAGKYIYVRVPLFDTGPVAGDSTMDVKGVVSLKPGTYDFLCAMHTGMKGQ